FTFSSQIFVRLGEGYLLAERRREARRAAERALKIAHDHKERGFEAWARHLLGKIAAHANAAEIEASDGHYQNALATAIDLGMRPLVAHCHTGLAAESRRTGKQR